MSIEALNSPPFVGILTAACYGALPFIVNNNNNNTPPSLSLSLSMSRIHLINLFAYGLSVYSVSRPGRYDGEAAVTDTDTDTQSNKKNDGNGKDDIDDKYALQRKEGMQQMGISAPCGRTLLPPAPWAFIIWAPIYIGELIMVSSPFLLKRMSRDTEHIIRDITGPFLLAQIFQSLWCASFRPKYDRRRIYKYLSVLNLGGTALSLSFCHNAFTSSTSRNYSIVDYWLYFLPLSLHFGWTTAATLVNLNGMYALKSNYNNKSNYKSNNDNDCDNSFDTAKSIALIGHASVVIATAMGVGITLCRNAPVYGSVICWALTAVSFGLKKRTSTSSRLSLHNNNNNDDISKKKISSNVVGIYGVNIQRTLCHIGAVACAVTSAYVVAFK